MKSLNISQKLVLSLIIISLLPYAVISYVNYSAEANAIEKTVMDDLSALAEAKKTHITTVVNFRKEQVGEIASTNFMQQIEERNAAYITTNLLRVKKEIPEFFEISALDPNGMVLASTESGLIGTDYSEDDLFIKAREKLYLGNINYYDNKTGYIISAPVLNRSTGKFIGVVAVRVYPRFIYDVTSDYTGLGKTGEALLVQKRDDEVVFLNPLRKNSSAPMTLHYSVNSSLARPSVLAVNGENGTVQALDYNGDEVFAAYTYIPSGEWGLVVKIDSREALIPAAKFKERSIALGLFYFVVIAILAYFLGRRFTDPLIRLSNASRKVAKGYLTVSIEPESRDEIGELAQSFNVMVQKLKEVYEGLDQKVKERTRDLNWRNLELSALIKTNQSISSGLDLKKVLEIAVREAVRIVNVSYCSIILVEEGKEQGTVVSEYSPGDELKPATGEILYLNDYPIVNKAYREKQYIMVPDTQKEELSPKEKEMADRLNIRSILIVPLVLGDKSLGTMQLSSLGDVKEFSEGEIGICRAIANQVAIAIENTRLYEEEQKAKKLSDALNNINTAINSTLDIDEILERITVESGRVLATEATGILMREGSYWVVRYLYGLPEEMIGMKFTDEEVSHIALAAHTKKPVAINDAYRDDRINPEIVDKFGVKSVLIVPMIVREEVIGVIGFNYHSASFDFTEAQIDFAGKLAASVSLAIENAHLYSELKRHDRTLETLFEIDRVVSRYLDIDEMLKEAIVKTIEVTSSDAGWIYLLEEDGETLSLKTHTGISTELAEAASKLKVGQGVSGLAVRSKEPVTLDIENYPHPELLPLMKKDSITSLAGIPLISKGKVVGAMILSNRKHRIFSKDDIDVLSSIGSQIGVAVENARLYSQLKHHDKTLETLFEIDRVVSQSLDLGEIFKESLAKTIQVTSACSGAIYLLEEDGKMLKLKTSTGISPNFQRAVSEIKVGEGIAGSAVQAKRPLYTDIDHYPSRDLLPYLEKEGIFSVVGVPLMAKGSVVGAMNLANCKRRDFSKEDIDLLSSIGGQIGVAVENARLYQEAMGAYKKLQEAYNELKSLDRMKSEFLSNVSHELKTPLVSIRGYSELIYDRKLGEISQVQNKAIEAIIRNSDRLTRLIDGLLFLSIQQIGKPDIKMKPRPRSVDEIITASIADMKVQAERKNITMIKDVPSGLMVTGDRDRLTEVFLNLIDNAIKFSHTEGKITIRAWEEEGSVRITVADTGIGIPEEVIPFLFQRFYQADASITRKYGGTGLGLYICKSIIDAHKGEIWIESKVGEGTTVHVRLPGTA